MKFKNKIFFSIFIFIKNFKRIYIFIIQIKKKTEKYFTAGGRPHRQMEPGMFFYQILADPTVSGTQQQRNLPMADLRDGVAVNGPGESSLEKLGWFRWERGQGWIVRKGLEKITQAQVNIYNFVFNFKFILFIYFSFFSFLPKFIKKFSH